MIKSTLLCGSDMAVADIVENYENITKSFIESHAPVQKRYVTLHPSSPWFTYEIYQLNVDGMLLSYQCVGRSA